MYLKLTTLYLPNKLEYGRITARQLVHSNFYATRRRQRTSEAEQFRRWLGLMVQGHIPTSLSHIKF